MYHEILLEHYKFPTHRGELESPAIKASDLNPSCGDQITFFLLIEDGIISSARFSGSGCIISQSSADILAAFSEKKTIEDLRAMDKDELMKLLEISLGPNRLKCALLSLQVLHKGLAEYRSV